VNQRTDDNVNKRNDPEALFFSVECVTMADNNNVGGEIIALTYAYDTHHTQQRYWRLGEFLPFRLDDANFRGIAKRGTRKGARDACLMLLVDGLVDAYLRETCRTAADQVYSSNLGRESPHQRSNFGNKRLGYDLIRKRFTSQIFCFGL
jgi:hypothetical protein